MRTSESSYSENALYRSIHSLLSRVTRLQARAMSGAFQDHSVPSSVQLQYSKQTPITVWCLPVSGYQIGCNAHRATVPHSIRNVYSVFNIM